MNESTDNHLPGDLSGAGSRPPSLSERVQSLRLAEHPRSKSSVMAWVPWVLCAVLLASTGLMALRLLEKNTEAADSAAADQKPAPVKDAFAPRTTPSAPGEITLESKGYIVPISMIQISPKVGGMVVKLNFEEGMRVTREQFEKGYVLAQLETVDYQADRDRAKAVAGAARFRLRELEVYRDDEILQAKAELEDSVAQRDQLLFDYKRSIGLRNTNALSPKEYEQAESSYKSMENRVLRLKLAYDLLRKGPRDERIAAARAEVEQAEADLVKAQWKLANCTVKAPIPGIILSKKAEEGNLVNPSAFSNGLSASLCEMADLTEMEVDLAIAERDIAKIFKGQDCLVRAEAYPDRPYQGYVSRVMPTADRAKGAVPVRVKIIIPRAEEGMYLRPEMGALVTFYNRKAKS